MYIFEQTLSVVFAVLLWVAQSNAHSPHGRPAPCTGWVERNTETFGMAWIQLVAALENRRDQYKTPFFRKLIDFID